MKFIRILLFTLFVAPFAANAATSEFVMAAQLLAAAKNADIQQVQALVNNGANVNFIDATGVSIVCTALMNNDIRAAQILQMYGADASKCDRQIKQYNNKTKPRDRGGLFSGLSSAQTISLAAAGAAVVVGGLLLLTDVFDPGNGNDSSSGGGNRPGGGGGGADADGTAAFTVPYSPAYLGTDGKINTSNATYLANLQSYNPAAGGLREQDFNYFRPSEQSLNNYLVDGIAVPLQNYLLMMHGYSAFANEYLGQSIFRDASKNPVVVSNATGGGAPVRVGLVTANGINPTGAAARAGGIEYASSAAADAPVYLVDKYLNYTNPTVVPATDDVPQSIKMGTELANFDLSGMGTAMNPFASSYDSALGKIISGWEAGGRVTGDLMGFVPNGQLGVFVTGNGKQWVDIENPEEGAVIGTIDKVGDKPNAIQIGDKIVINGVNYVIGAALTDATITNPTITVNGTTYKLAENSDMLIAKCDGDETVCADVSDVAIYQGTDGLFYVNSMGGNSINAVYTVNSGNLYAAKELQDADFKNFEALYLARGVTSDVIANAGLIDASRAIDYLSVSGFKNLIDYVGGTPVQLYVDRINMAYDRNSDDVNSQGQYANGMFGAYSAGAPIIVMPAGEFAFGNGAGKSATVLDATFENYAPALYDNNLNHMFMTVVAVNHKKGTDAATSIENYGNGTGDSFGKLGLSTWVDNGGTTDVATDDITYMSRKCGATGLGVGSIDPWCFAAAGPTAEMATATAAGAVASLQGAFDYMTNPQIYLLMALTSDGYLLGTDNSGNTFTVDTLKSYLQAMYALPGEYNESTLSSADYLKSFAEVYGYGLINLERAMTPGKSVYFFDGNKIVSANGNAYWRAATGTSFKPSSVLNIRGSTVRAPFYDVLQSVDGSLSLPRVWENEFAMGNDDKRGLYMGDVLGDLKTRREDALTTNVGNMSFSMAMSERAYADNFNGLDYLSLGYKSGNWNFGASYQHYLTDGMSRFDGVANPVLGLMSNAVVSDVKYNLGNLSFGARAFSGAITDEGLLENDPTITAEYIPATLGLMQGAQSDVMWSNDKFAFGATLGMARETDTLLGAYTDGLLNFGAGDTTYVDLVAKYNPTNLLNFMARATFAHTTSDAAGNFVLGLSDINSNSFAVAAKVGNFEFAVAQPLAITAGTMKYAYANYDVVGNGDMYELDVVDTHIADLSLRPDKRELRFSGTYRHNFGEFTDGAFGFIYRVNPNHTDDFGNESVFMLKMTHRVGI